MKLGSMSKKKGTRVIGIDSSTKSLAFAVFENDLPVTCGEVFFTGSTVTERLKDAKNKTRELVKSGVLKADYVAIEASIMVKSPSVAIDMSLVLGAILGELMVNNPEVHRVPPITWQTGIGNPNLKADEKAKIKKENPDQKPSWYQNAGRKLRKQRTLDIAKQHFTIQGDSDNVGDAVGLALYTNKHLTRRA